MFTVCRADEANVRTTTKMNHEFSENQPKFYRQSMHSRIYGYLRRDFSLFFPLFENGGPSPNTEWIWVDWIGNNWDENRIYFSSAYVGDQNCVSKKMKNAYYYVFLHRLIGKLSDFAIESFENGPCFFFFYWLLIARQRCRYCEDDDTQTRGKKIKFFRIISWTIQFQIYNFIENHV